MNDIRIIPLGKMLRKNFLDFTPKLFPNIKMCKTSGRKRGKESVGELNRKYEGIIRKCGGTFAKRPYVNYIFTIVYKVLLDLIYCAFLANKHSFCYMNISVINVINGWIAVIIMAMFINEYCRMKTASAILMIAFDLMYFIPLTTYCGYGGGSSSFLFFALVYWFILSTLQVKIPMVPLRVNWNDMKTCVFYIIELFLSIASIYMWAKYTNFRLLTDILNVYEIRAEAASYQMSIGLSYVRLLLPTMISMLIILALNKKKYLSVIWLLLMTWLNFSFAGDKTMALLPIVLIGGFVFYRSDMINLIIPIGVFLQIVAIVEQILGSGLLVSFLFRRQGILLSSLSEEYYRFFLEHPTDIFRQGILNKIGFDSIYSNSLANVIGNNFRTQVINCNNGLLSDVWSNLGVIGLIIMPIIIIICFRLLDLVSYGVNSRLTIGITLYYAIAFANSSWSTTLLSHGFIIVCIMLLVFPRNSRRLTI